MEPNARLTRLINKIQRMRRLITELTALLTATAALAGVIISFVR
ncbi:hypothetical protein [Dactylosporangium sp. CA-092794]